MFWLMRGEKLVLALAAALHLPFAASLAVQLDHSQWLGFTCWDFIAPLFLFVVGLSMPYAISKRLERGEGRRGIYLHIVRRTLLLIALGLLFNGILKLDFANFRYAGVLQRIALSYFFAALITMGARVRGQMYWTAGLLLGYWAAMTFIPVPGFGAGVFTGADRWLDIGVRTNGAPGVYQVLTPRQPLSATPYAVRAANFSGAVSDSQLSGNIPLLSAGKLPDASLSTNIARLNASHAKISRSSGATMPAPSTATAFWPRILLR